MGFGERLAGCSDSLVELIKSQQVWHALCHSKWRSNPDVKYPAKTPPHIITFRVTRRQVILQTKQKAMTQNMVVNSINQDSGISSPQLFQFLLNWIPALHRFFPDEVYKRYPIIWTKYPSVELHTQQFYKTRIHISLRFALLKSCTATPQR